MGGAERRWCSLNCVFPPAELGKKKKGRRSEEMGLAGLLRTGKGEEGGEREKMVKLALSFKSVQRIFEWKGKKKRGGRNEKGGKIHQPLRPRARKKKKKKG